MDNMSKQVELIAKTIPLIEGVDTASFSAFIARIGKVKDNPEKLMKYLLKHKHFSPFQHTYFTFQIETSRAIGRELLRHLSFTFQEKSQRYEEALDFQPIELRKQAETNRQSSEEVFDPLIEDYYNLLPHEKTMVPASMLVDKYLETIAQLYEDLLKSGVAKECARMILPEATTTTILMTGSIRSWIHFLELRDDSRAQKEAQIIAKAIREELIKEVPFIFTKPQ